MKKFNNCSSENDDFERVN